jgi:hypothetical protein
MGKYIFWIGFAILFGACSSPQYLSKPRNFKYHVKGLYIDILTFEKTKISGEIIEVDSNHMIINPLEKASNLITVLKDSIKSAEIIVSITSNDPKMISRWAGLINVASLGHGYWGLLTLPHNLAITIPISINAAKSTYRVKYPEAVDWNQLPKFARFPQGIPESINPEWIN